LARAGGGEVGGIALMRRGCVRGQTGEQRGAHPAERRRRAGYGAYHNRQGVDPVGGRASCRSGCVVPWSQVKVAVDCGGFGE